MQQQLTSAEAGGLSPGAGVALDERRILCAPAGYCWTLCMAAWVKAWIASPMPASERLTMLEGLDGMVGQGVTREAVAAVAPFCQTADAIMREALSAGDGFPDLVANPAVFRVLARLNPSLLTALKMCSPEVGGH